MENMTKLPLPPEIIVHISKYLNIQEKLKLRLINKSFKFVFDNLIKLDRLIVMLGEDPFDRNWFFTNSPMHKIDLIEYNFDPYSGIRFDRNILYKLFKDQLFVNVRKLFFYFSMEINFNDTVNHFKYLEELNVDCMLESSSTISLSRLRILCIDINEVDNSDIKVELDTPSLLNFRCENLTHYQFNYPETLTYFDTCNLPFNDVDSIKAIEKFQNLECLILKFKRINVFKSIITKLNHLTQLHIYTKSSYQINDPNGFNDLNEFNDLYEHKLKLKLNNLRMFLSGIDYEYLKESNENLSEPVNQLELILRNYSRTIDILPLIENMDFDKLFQFLNSNPDVSLDHIVHKFPNIKRLEANNLTTENVDCFFEFLSKCDNLIDLKFKLLFDDQINYLNRLPSLCKSIKRLNIEYFDIDESTNLDFLYEFTNLIELTLGKIEDLNILVNLSNNVPNSRPANRFVCTYLYKENLFNIKYYNDAYHLDHNNRCEQFRSRNELFEHLDNLIK